MSIKIQNVSILDFIGAKDDGGAGDNWSYKTCKAPVKSSPTPHNCLQDRCPCCCPTNRVESLRVTKEFSVNI